MSTYACSDLHGMYDLWSMIKDFLQPNDTLYFLGDAADRGNFGYQIIKELLEDKRVIYLKGNHEDMMVNGAMEYIKTNSFGHNSELWCLYNGGIPTFEQWREDGCPTDILFTLKQLPTCLIYCNLQGQNIYLMHAGYNINSVDIMSEEDALWDRSHYFGNWYGKNNEYLVHGHTIGEYLIKDLNTYVVPYEENFIQSTYPIVEYCYGHKFDIDCGSAYTDMITLLNLDTWEKHVFKGEKG